MQIICDHFLCPWITESRYVWDVWRWNILTAWSQVNNLSMVYILTMSLSMTLSRTCILLQGEIMRAVHSAEGSCVAVSWFHNCQIMVYWVYKISQLILFFRNIQGVPKTQFSGILAITPLWIGLELKVGGVSKTSGNSLCDRHKNFPIWPIKSWENWVQRWQPYLKNLDKNGGIFFCIELFFLDTL